MQNFQPTQAATVFLEVRDRPAPGHIHTAAARHTERAADTGRARLDDGGDHAGQIVTRVAELGSPVELAKAWAEYARDAAQRAWC